MRAEQLQAIRAEVEARQMQYPRGEDLIILALLQHIDYQEALIGDLRQDIYSYMELTGGEIP